MNIAFVNQPWNAGGPPAQAGSIAIWIYEIARRLAQSCNVIVYAKRGRFQNKIDRCEGVDYRRIAIGPDKWLRRLLDRFSGLRDVRHPLFSSSLYYLGYILQVANDLRVRQCDIVHVHNLSQFVPVLRSFNRGIKIVLHMHCEWLTQLDRAMIERRLREVDLVIGCSDYITEKIRRRFPEFAKRCHTVFNGVDVNRFVSKSRASPQEKDGAKRLLFVGRISPEKGLHVLLDSFQKVIERYPQTQLEIVGPKQQSRLAYIVDLSDDDKVADLASFYGGSRPSYFSQLKERIVSLDVASHTTLCGAVPHGHIISYYRNADVFVNPSFSDAFPMTITEAMASGLPVVATHVGGVPEAVTNNKTGLLVEPGNALELAEAILRLLADRDLRETMGNVARQRAVDLFSWEQVAKNLLFQYEGICDGNE